MKDLDFLIIGAQKCATTTLFEHLRAHPDIAMPLEKEVPFFTEQNCDAEAWARFAARHFGDAPAGGQAQPPGSGQAQRRGSGGSGQAQPPGSGQAQRRGNGQAQPPGSGQAPRLWGKATPQYMCDPSAAARIHRLMPDTRLIAILRDPVERCWSHYRMGRRRGTEARSFAGAVEELLAPARLERGQSLPVPTHRDGYESEADFYIAWSEYGRALESYAELFPAQQLLVLYTEELEHDPAGTLDRILAFIGLEPGFRPPGLGTVAHRGGGSNRIPHGLRVWLRQRQWLYRLWQMLPAERQGALRFRYEQWNVRRRGGEQPELPGDVEAALVAHFSRDLQRLLYLPVSPPPWLARYLPDAECEQTGCRKLRNPVLA